ncbi:hypothetical protein [Geminisphaera colitermitum]|uniref:hypothetical protein n=1 Tax=Geminisphaera colitermitum TaxID=1148786 RepID=UPI00019655D3|nr:hypothetical protein [Geminisphaera colitermitum]
MKTFKQVREELRAVLATVPELNGATVLVEHAGADIDGDVERALASAGLVLVVWTASTAVADSARGGSASVRVALPVSIIENPPVNMQGEGGKCLPLEDALQAAIAGVIGKPCGDGEVSLGQEVFARAEADAGELEVVVGFEAPLVIRARRG